MADDDPLLRAASPGAQLVVRVQAERIFPNCPRYIHRLAAAEPSPYVPREGQRAAGAEVEALRDVRDVLPRGDPAREPEPPAKG